MGNTHIMTGNIITGFNEDKSKTENLKEKLAEAFKVKENTPDKIEKKARGPIKEITVNNLSSLESKDIKNTNWETITPSKKASETVVGINSIHPSRSGIENNYGGSSTLSNSLNSIFNPEALASNKNSDFTNHVISAGKEYRKNISKKGKPSRDWEVEQKSLTTKDISATMMGFTPNKSAFSPSELPKVNIPQIKIIKEQAEKSKEAGIKAAEMKINLDRVMAQSYENQRNDNRRWEDIESEKIYSNQNKEMPIRKENITLAKDFVSDKLPKTKIDLNGIFKVPENPIESKKESSIKKDISDSTQSRGSREDDRSWEKVREPKKTW